MPETKAQVRRGVTVTLTDDMLFDVKTRPGDYHFQVDSVTTSYEQMRGASPIWLMLVALAGCAAMDVLSILRKKRQVITNFEVQANALRAEEHPKVFTDVDLLFLVEGNNVDPDALERSIELAQTKYCPAWAMMKQVVPISVKYEIKQSE